MLEWPQAVESITELVVSLSLVELARLELLKPAVLFLVVQLARLDLLKLAVLFLVVPPA